MRRLNTGKKRNPLAKTLFTVLFWMALLATIATSTWACLPDAWQSWNPQNGSVEGVSHTELIYNTEQPKARRLFLEVLEQLETLYADEHFNHQQMSQWKTHYYEQIRHFEDAYVAIESTIASLNDPYTHFFRPDQYAEQNMALSSKLYGIGVEISLVDDAITIMNLIPNSPALACKSLHIGDVITHIDGISVHGWTTLNVAKRIRGKKDTSVILTIKNPEGHSEKVKVTRDEINLLHVQVIELAQHPEIGFIRLQSFMGTGISNEFRHALEQVKNRPYLIIDLRNNGGGMLSNAIDIADLFLDRQVIVQVEGRDSVYDNIYKGHAGTLYDGKVALLINEGSASASEVLAGALHDEKKALLVGRKTYGKGMVQEVIPLESYSVGLTLTVAHYLTPKGQNLNHVGLLPDLPISEKLIRQSAQKGDDVVLNTAIKALKGH